MERIFAEIPVAGSDGFGAPDVVRCLVSWSLPQNPEAAPGTVVYVDVTDHVPAVAPGCTYDSVLGTFAGFPEPAPPPEDPGP